MDVRLAGAFWLVSMLFVMTPGADWAYAMAAGLRHRSIGPATVGLLSGHVAATLAVAAGVAAFVAGRPMVLAGVTVVGAAYLTWLGILTLRHPATPEVENSGLEELSTVRQVLGGFGVSGLNPKVFLLFLALMPQFTDPDRSWPLATQILLLGLVHVLNCAVIYTAVGAGARVVLRTRPTAARLASRLSGGAMVGIGSILLIEQITH